MELSQISNNDFLNNIQAVNQSSHIEAEAKNKEVSTIDSKSDIVSLESQRTDVNVLSPIIRERTDNIISIQNVQKSLNTQLDTLNDLDSFIKLNQNDLDSFQPQISSMMENYNASSSYTYESLHELTEVLNNGNSHSYFDGVVGAIPLSFEEINEAIAKQKQTVLNQNNTLNNQVNEVVNATKELINSQTKDEIKDKSFENVNFGIESKDFSSNNLNAFSSSIVSVQAKPLQSASIRLLA